MKGLQITLAVLLAVTAAMLSGCVNNYAAFYKPVPEVTLSQALAHRVGPPPETPIVEHAEFGTPDLLLAYAKRGYVVIGTSFYNSGRVEDDYSALKQAKNVGADLVLIFDPKYTGSVTTSVPITTPTTSTSYSTGAATAYGSGGVVNAYGSGTTTTYGSTTSYVPMTINRSDYGAAYFVKERIVLGAFVRDLSDAERAEIQSNKGAAVIAVANNSPAFNADILPGDIIVEISGRSISGQQAMIDLLQQLRGQAVEVSLIRNGARISKSIQLGE